MPTNPGVSEVQDKNGVVADIEAKRFDGTRTVQIQGDVTASQTWNGDSSYPLTLNASIGAKKVTQDKIGDKAVGSGQMDDGSVGLMQMDPNAMTSSATSGDTRLITAGGVRTEIDNAILNRGKDYGPMTPTQINAISDTIPTGSTVHVTAAGTITDGDIEVRRGEDLKYYRSGNTHYWYSTDGDFKLKQQPKTSPTASGNALSFIDSVAQDENGEIFSTKKTVQDGTTLQKGVVQLEDSTSSTSTTMAATPNSVKQAYDLADGKQDPITFEGTYNASTNKAATESTVSAAIDALEAEITSIDGTNVQVKVSEENGKITEVNVTTDNTENNNNKVTSWQGTPDNTHYPSEKLVKDSLDAISTAAGVEAEVTAAALDGLDARMQSVEETVNSDNIGDRFADSFDAQVLKSGGEAVSPGANKVEASQTNGNIKIDGTETNVYSHPTTMAVSAAAVKVGKDSTGHVVLGTAIEPSDIGAATSAQGSKADSAIQGVKVNGTLLTPDSSEFVNVPAATDSDYGAVQFMTSQEAANLWANAWSAATA